ncbi:segregation/condensation protein A [Candidatus Saganbacteria bacterium]|nr:segregation/condensation protein A [Candidatus Saganbacteria bacterium]
MNVSQFQITQEIYSGPFDMLLASIKDSKIDVFEISLSAITSSYFEHLRGINIINLNFASEFLIMASILLEMKSKKLLPRPEEAGLQLEEDEIESDLVYHLEEYKIFKSLAATLKLKKDTFRKVYSRYHREVLGPDKKDFYLKDVNLQDLILAFKRVYDSISETEETQKIQDDDITLPMRIEEVLKMLKDQTDGIHFEGLFIRKTRIEVVVTFLAVLELAKRGSIKISQGGHFGGIRIFGA